MRSLASIVLGFEALVLALVTPVMISVAHVSASTALPVCLGLALLAIAAAGLLRSQVGYALGWVVQVGAVGLGFVVPVMFVLGLAFAGFWVMAIVLGRRIEGRSERERADATRRVTPATGEDRLTPKRDRRTPERDMSQRTLVLLKPDAVRRGLIGEILGRVEAKGLTIVAMDLRTIDAEMADQHYAEHVEKAFYPPLRDFVTSGPLVALVLEGAADVPDLGAFGQVEDEVAQVTRVADRHVHEEVGGSGHDEQGEESGAAC